MKLEELKKKLYKPETEFEKRLKEGEFYQPGKKKEEALAEEWQEIEKGKLSAKQRKYLLVGGFSFGIVFLVIVGLLVWHGLTSFDKDEVRLEIRGPERVVSGEEINYTVRYQNKTRLDLGEVKLVFYYPEGSIPRGQKDLIQTFDLPTLAAGQENQLELPVRIIGLKGEAKTAWAELSYQPGKISSRFANRAELLTTIVSVPLILDFDLPEPKSLPYHNL